MSPFAANPHDGITPDQIRSLPWTDENGNITSAPAVLPDELLLNGELYAKDVHCFHREQYIPKADSEQNYRTQGSEVVESYHRSLGMGKPVDDIPALEQSDQINYYIPRKVNLAGIVGVIIIILFFLFVCISFVVALLPYIR